MLSGGSGKRFGADIPKQYIEINGKPILSYALQAFQESAADEIIIVAGADHAQLCRSIAEQAGITKLTAVIEGGSERYYSVMKGLKYLYDASGKDPGIALIHDGARPFVSPSVIERVTDAVREHGAAVAAVPCTDTIKITDDDGNIISTTDRSHTWAAQTPQGFMLEDIYRAYDTVLSSSFRPDQITDDAMVYQLAYPDRMVKAVLSDGNNMKITRAQDLKLAGIMLS